MATTSWLTNIEMTLLQRCNLTSDKKNLNSMYFFKMAAIPNIFHHISPYIGHTVVILMAIPRFGGLSVEEFSGTIIYAQKCTNAHMAAIFFFKMAAKALI